MLPELITEHHHSSCVHNKKNVAGWSLFIDVSMFVADEK